MGVTGLWKLIEPCGKPVPVETLEGKILAVDISIWLHQVIKGFQDNKGSALSHAHLLGLFHRLCKLLYYRVKPVFVFDGCVPQLKRDTIARRQMQRSKLNNEAERLEAILLQALAKEKIVQQALGVTTAAELAHKSPLKNKKKISNLRDDDDIFKLPDLPPDSCLAHVEQEKQNDASCSSFTSDEYTSTDDSSFDTSISAYHANLQAIDVRSHHFRNLPADVRHEILVDIKETRKQSSWGRLHELPARSTDFSEFQMKRLLKRRAVQESLQEAEKEMGGRTLTYAELNMFLSDEGIVEPSVLDTNTKQICSDENTRFLLVRDLKKKLSKVKEETEDDASMAKIPKSDNEIKPEAEKTECMSINIKNEESPDESNPLGNEYEKDLQLAIALSLEQDSHVYSQKDYEYKKHLKLNKEQRQQLRDATTGPAKAYMIEYGGMNDDEVVGIMDRTQADKTQNSDFDYTMLDETVIRHDEKRKREMLEAARESKLASEESIITTEKSSDFDKDLDSETDSDLEEVGNSMEIILDIKAPIMPTDDIFADIFANKRSETKDANISFDTDIITVDSDESNNDKKQNNLKSIISELGKQMANVKNLALEDIDDPNSAIVLSDEETSVANQLDGKLKQEIIEICDSDGGQQQNVACSSNHLSKSPKLKTPNKNKSITEFFDTKYIVKRTPEKESEIEDDSNIPKVQSPFFVKKSKSAQKRSEQRNGNNESISSPSEKSKVVKSLFYLNEIEQTKQANLGVEPLIDTAPPSKNTEDLMKEAADVLKQQKSDAELETLAAHLAKERRNIEAERNRQDRMGMSINQRMSSECQELLRLFGVPYIVAPMEAEAQCAFLDAIQLTNGTITDDSDIWLFGGSTVYKNFFAQDKHVLEFKMEKIQQSFNCDRKKLIQLACLVGSDYTTGIHGIGAVTALEILALFSKELPSDDNTNCTNINGVVAALCKFRDWWYASKNMAAPPGSSARLSLLKKLKNINLHEGFPNSAIAEAYLCPTVDDNKETFTWGYPDVQSIREFTKKTFGWTTSKTDDILNPVIRKLNEKKTQATLRNYFSVKISAGAQQMPLSKRVRKAIDRMSAPTEDHDTPEKVTKKKATLKRGKEKNTKAVETKSSCPLNEKASTSTFATNVGSTPEVISEGVHTSTRNTTTIAKTRSSKIPRIPNTKQSIPQRNRDVETLRKNKEKAVQILKTAKKSMENK